MKRLVLCITGASGSIYGYRAIQVLSDLVELDVVVSSTGWLVIKEELDKTPEELKAEFPKARFFKDREIDAPIASGSVLSAYEGVLVLPCSMSTLGSIASGVNNNLIHRVCEVALKERVKLVVVVREMPYSRIHIENMLRVTDAGGIVMPASPGFYHKPKTIMDMVDFVVGKALDSLGIEHSLYNRWKGGGT